VEWQSLLKTRYQDHKFIDGIAALIANPIYFSKISQLKSLRLTLIEEK